MPVSSVAASGTPCQVVLMQSVFASSFGKPFVGDYRPPPRCMADADVVMMNLTVTTRGQQFDRLAIMYFGASEVFRTSTEEPKRDGIVWTYVKDMSEYMYFWKSPQTLIFDLPNQTNVNLTGVFNTTLTATFLKLPNLSSQTPPATLILPISNGNTTSPSVFRVPENTALTTLKIPRNTNRAVFSLSATGQGDEEFWWSNVFTSSIATFAQTTTNGTLVPGSLLSGNSPFREVQVYMDGMLVGVQWPFPVIFTGGVILSFWNPVVGIDAFDLKEYEIDVSPFLGVLCDGGEHTFEIRVVGLDDNGVTASLSKNTTASWVVSGKLFLWTDEDANAVTTGDLPKAGQADGLNIQMSQGTQKNSTGQNIALDYTLSVSRNLSLEATITTKKFGVQRTRWSQRLAHTDNARYAQSGFNQINKITTEGTDIREGAMPSRYTYTYPLEANITVVQTEKDSNFTVFGSLRRSKNTTLAGSSVHPNSLLAFETLDRSRDVVKGLDSMAMNISQMGSGLLFKSEGKNVNRIEGNTTQSIRMSGISRRGVLDSNGMGDVEFFWREVGVTNGTIKKDKGRVIGMEIKKNA
ncbi:hypothetical protein HYALB_00013646 [Hymenoscyphus albidus]|uniref:Peptide N-acetyl-beta-D-glucosaminyl asparaginase amidase A N-terminal domain-containing protein n=1 Tax=Hymenoscyphus albidus TaxID=595503 RepID=A0A9N9M176_9HELO|nr:hypothetical protein HYALB_00013646 [Hymenoscyphus albidus]